MTNKDTDPLFEYQRQGAQFLAERTRACLYDEQGVGKSAQSIRACEMVEAKSILVICRAVGVENWKNEFRRWFWPTRRLEDESRAGSVPDSSPNGPNLSPRVAARSRDKVLRLGGAEIYVSSYESLHKVEKAQSESGHHFDVCIIDEAHYLKEPTALRTQKILGRTGVVHRAQRVWLLTGTPTPNHAAELWTTLYSFGRTKLSYAAFCESFCRTRETPFGTQITGTRIDRVPELKKLAKGLALRRTKEQVLTELPPIFFQDLVVEPKPIPIGLASSFVKHTYEPGGQQRLTNMLEKELGVMAAIIDGRFLSMEVIKALESKAKSIMTLRRYTGLQKIEAVYDLVSGELDAEAYDKIVIFCVHRDTVEILRSKFSKKYNAVHAYGGTDPIKLEARINRFQNYNSCRVFIGNIQSAGTSITLTAANQVLFIEQSFVPGDMAQAAMRCHRIGQTKPVTVRFVGLANSIDQYIAELLRKKTAEISKLMEGFGEPEPPERTTAKDADRKGKNSLTVPFRADKVTDLF